MFSIEEFIIAVFCGVDDPLKALTQAHPIRKGIDSDKGIWSYFRQHWLSLFPHLASRCTFVRQAANLWQYKHQLQERFAAQLGAVADDIHLVDGLPIRLCCLTYAGRCCSFRGEAAYGYCAAKDEKFYGFRGHLCISLSGVITGFTLTPANVDEREAVGEITEQVQGLLIGDKGYISQPLQAQLAQRQIDRLKADS